MSKHRSTSKKAAKPKSKKHRSPKQIAAAKKNLAKARAARARKHRKYGRPEGWTAMNRWQRKAARAKQRANRGPRVHGGARFKARMAAKAGTIAQTSYLAGLRARLAAQKAAAAGRAPLPLPEYHAPVIVVPTAGVAAAMGRRHKVKHIRSGAPR